MSEPGSTLHLELVTNQANETCFFAEKPKKKKRSHKEVEGDAEITEDGDPNGEDFV